MNDNEKSKKLDWMYKGATSLVDREEYLLGRSVDKSLEQLNQEEKEKKLGIVPPKNHVEHECIPPSIRDYNKMVQAEQVDLSAKLQEDPLVAIRKREEEARRLFLQNPIQLKKLHEALKAQECKKIERKQERHLKKLKESDSDSDLDRKIATKLKSLKSGSADLSILKKPKKKNDDSLDIVLMHKYNQLKDKLSQKDLNDILEGRVSSSSENSTGSESNNSESIKKGKNRKQKTKRTRRTNSSEQETETIIENKKKGREKRSLKTKNKGLRDSSTDDSDSGDDRKKNKDKMTKDKYWKKEENIKKWRSSSPEDEKTRKYTKVNKNNEKRSFLSSDSEEKNRNWRNRSKKKVEDRKKSKAVSCENRKRTYSGSSAEEDKKLDVNSGSRVDILTKGATNKTKSKEKVKIENKKRHRKYSDSTDSSDEEHITKRKDRYDDNNERENYSTYKYSVKKRKNISDDNRSDNKNRRKQDDSSNDEHSKQSRYDSRKSLNRSLKSESSSIEEERRKESSCNTSSINDNKKGKMTRHEQNSKICNTSSSESEKLIKTNEKVRSSDIDSNNSEYVDNSLDQLILQKLRMLRDSKPVKTSQEKDLLSSKNEGIYSHYDSDDDKLTYKVKLFGLVKSDGTKIPLNISSQEEKKVPAVKKIEPLKLPERKTVKKLTEKEKEKLRQQMMKDAVTREKERSDNLRKYREDDRREELERTTKEFDKNFLHKELLKGTSSASVESRIKSKLNNIQRSSRDMTTNFSKRN